jgi:hypothetical protein
MDSSGEIVDEELDFHLEPTEDEFRRWRHDVELKFIIILLIFRTEGKT